MEAPPPSAAPHFTWLPAHIRQFVAWIEVNPRYSFSIFAAVHAAIWTLLPVLLYPNLPLDLIEARLYGREWQLGYDKLPPLPWWIVEAAYQAVGADMAYYLIAQIAVVIGFAFVFLTALPLVGALGALVSVLIIDGLHYVNFSAAKFNHDVIQLPFWAMAGYAFREALTRGRLFHWVMLGVAIGCALWAKYFAITLAVPLALFMLLDGRARKSLRTAGPWVALATALVIAAPHILWLIKNDFLPFAYASMRSPLPMHWWHHITRPAIFAGSQLFFMLPGLAIAAAMIWPRTGAHAEPVKDFDRRIVTLLAFGPCATVLVMAAVSGRGTIAMWGYPLWMFLGLWVVIWSGMLINITRLTRIVIVWMCVFISIAAAFVINYSVLPYFDYRYRAVFFPGEKLAPMLAQKFRDATGQPLAYVISTMWDGGNIAHYAREHPRVLIEGKPERAPWIDLADMKKKGALVLWTSSEPMQMPEELAVAAPKAVLQPVFTVPFQRGDSDHDVYVNWAIVPPQP